MPDTPEQEVLSPDQALIRAGDVEVRRVNLYSSQHRQPFNLGLIWQNISIYESIESNYIRGEITLTDTQNIITEAPIISNEKIEIVFRTAGATEDHTFIGRIVGIKNRSILKQGMQIYVLDFMSQEFVKSQSVKFSKAYHNTLISDMVDDIYRQYIKPVSNKSLNIVATLNTDSKVVPNFSPFKAINWLAKWARSPSYRTGASYVMFENQYGYYFGPIEALIDDNNVPNPSVVYSQSILQAQEATQKDIKKGFYNIQSIIPNTPDHLGMITNGVYSSNLLVHDPVLNTTEKRSFNYFNEFKNIKHVNSNSGANDTQLMNDSAIGDLEDSLNILAPSHYRAFDTADASRTQSTALIRNTQLHQYKAFNLKLTVPGDSRRAIGEIIELRVPSAGATTLIDREGESDKYLSGRYLIYSLRHEITRPESGQRPKYTLIMRVCKDTFKSPLPKQQIVHWR